MSLSGEGLFTIGSPGKGPGNLDWPGGGRSFSRDECYVCDTGNHRVNVYRASDGEFLRSFSQLHKSVARDRLDRAVERAGESPRTEDGEWRASDRLRAPYGVGLHGRHLYITEWGREQECVSILDGEAREGERDASDGESNGELDVGGGARRQRRREQRRARCASPARAADGREGVRDARR